jgi:hypothetical protein
LDGGLVDATPQVQAEYAHTLLAILGELQRRIVQAPMVGMVPQVEGLAWHPDDPFVGLIEGIEPFHKYEHWQDLARSGEMFYYAATITSEFEARGSYSAYQNQDVGGISYGAYQFTQTGGALYSVLRRWVDDPESAVEAPGARAVIAPVIAVGGHGFRTNRALRGDRAFEHALRQAGRTSSMERAQDDVARERMFTPAVGLASEAGIHSRIGQAIFFDTNNGSPRMLRRIVEGLRETPAYVIGEREFLHRFLDLRERYTLQTAAAHERRAAAARRGGDIPRAEQLEANAAALRRSPERRLRPLHRYVDQELPDQL